MLFALPDQKCQQIATGQNKSINNKKCNLVHIEGLLKLKKQINQAEEEGERNLIGICPL